MIAINEVLESKCKETHLLKKQRYDTDSLTKRKNML